MRVSERVHVDSRTVIGWYTLPPPAREDIQRQLDALAGRPREQWPGDRVEPWRPEEQIYALHTYVGPDHLLVFFQPEEDRIRLMDMILKETLDRYFTLKTEPPRHEGTHFTPFQPGLMSAGPRCAP